MTKLSDKYKNSGGRATNANDVRNMPKSGSKTNPEWEKFEAKVQRRIDNLFKTEKITESYPIEVLSERLQGIFAKANKDRGLSINYMAAAFMVTASGLMGNCYHLNMDGHWKEPPMLWTIINGTASILKSPSVTFVTGRVINLILQDMKDKLEIELEEWEDKRKRKDKGEKVFVGPKPKLTNLFFKDCTIESLQFNMDKYPKGSLFIGVEMRTFMGNFNRYKKGNSDRSLMLEVYSGNDLPVMRALKQYYIKNPHLAILVETQPSVLDSIMSNEESDDGFFPRFNHVFCEMDEEPITSLNDPHDEVGMKYIDEMLMVLHNMNYDDAPTETYFDEEAKGVYDTWKNGINRDEGRDTANESLKSVYGKFRGLVGRISLILWALEYAEKKVEFAKMAENFADVPNDIKRPSLTLQITANIVRDAIKVVEYYRTTAKFVYRNTNFDHVPEDVKVALERYAKGETQTKIANVLKISGSTISRMKKDYPDLFGPVSGLRKEGIKLQKMT